MEQLAQDGPTNKAFIGWYLLGSFLILRVAIVGVRVWGEWYLPKHRGLLRSLETLPYSLSALTTPTDAALMALVLGFTIAAIGCGLAPDRRRRSRADLSSEAVGPFEPLEEPITFK